MSNFDRPSSASAAGKEGRTLTSKQIIGRSLAGLAGVTLLASCERSLVEKPPAAPRTLPEHVKSRPLTQKEIAKMENEVFIPPRPTVYPIKETPTSTPSPTVVPSQFPSTKPSKWMTLKGPEFKGWESDPLVKDAVGYTYANREDCNRALGEIIRMVRLNLFVQLNILRAQTPQQPDEIRSLQDRINNLDTNQVIQCTELSGSGL
jgi:hypothetical protein